MEIARGKDLELCRVSAPFRFTKFVQKIDLAPEGPVPLDCQFASWDFDSRTRNNYWHYMTWEEARINGADEIHRHLNVDEIVLFPVQGRDRTSLGAGLVCGAGGVRRYLFGIRDNFRVRFVDLRRGYLEWVEKYVDLD